MTSYSLLDRFQKKCFLHLHGRWTPFPLLDIIHRPDFFLRQCFGGWALSPCSDKNPSLLGPIYTEIESNLRIVASDKIRTTNTGQNIHTCNYTPLPSTLKMDTTGSSETLVKQLTVTYGLVQLHCLHITEWKQNFLILRMFRWPFEASCWNRNDKHRYTVRAGASSSRHEVRSLVTGEHSPPALGENSAW